MRLGLFTDGLAHLPLGEALDWLAEALPAVRDLEIGTGGYSPAHHCNHIAEVGSRGYRIAALNVSGNPLEIPEHDRALRDTIQLARELGIGRVVCMSGGDPKLSGGAWFPGLEEAVERYWEERVLPYWRDFADVEGIQLCLELEPGSAVYNVSTFERLAQLGPSLAVNLDPSHFFWQGIDPLAAVRRLIGRIGFAHGKDTVLIPARVEVDGLVDRGAWHYATVGRGHDAAWWRSFIEALHVGHYDYVVSIEVEDPFVAPEECILESARVLEQALERVTA